MYEQLELDNPELDNLLANFTDQVLSVEGDAAALSDDATLFELEETVMLLQRTITHTAPDAATSTRIRNRVSAAYSAEWQKAQRSSPAAERRKPARTWWDSFKLRSIIGNRRQLAFSLAAIVVVLVVGMILLGPGLDTSITGTAGKTGDTLPLLILLSIVALLGGIIWFFRSKR